MWCFGFASRLTERNPKRVAEGIDASAPTPPDMLGPVDANAPKTDLPASSLTRGVPRGLRFTAPIEVNAVAQLLFLISLGMTACAPPASNNVPPILLFNGTGTSANDVTAVETILKNRHLKYSTVNSWQLNGMSESQLMSYRLMIVPGGNYITIGNGLTPGTHRRLTLTNSPARPPQKVPRHAQNFIRSPPAR